MGRKNIAMNHHANAQFIQDKQTCVSANCFSKIWVQTNLITFCSILIFLRRHYDVTGLICIKWRKLFDVYSLSVLRKELLMKKDFKAPERPSIASYFASSKLKEKYPMIISAQHSDTLLCLRSLSFDFFFVGGTPCGLLLPEEILRRKARDKYFTSSICTVLS